MHCPVRSCRVGSVWSGGYWGTSGTGNFCCVRVVGI